MSGFESPNYTQTPNDLFKMLPEMGDAELRVTLVMVRQTFGFHRDGFKMSVSKLAKAAGLSRQGALDGAEKAEERGTFKRSNPDEQKEAEWELYVPLNSIDTPLQPVEGYPPASRGQVGVKERIKKDSKESKEILKNSDIGWLISSGETILQEDQNRKVLEQEARDEFEKAFNMNPPWFGSKDWTDAAKEAARVYKQDKENRKSPGNVWLDYCKWAEDVKGGKFGKAMSSVAIRKNPKMFFDTALPTFLAHSAMYGKRGEPEVDDFGAPISY